MVRKIVISLTLAASTFVFGDTGPIDKQSARATKQVIMWSQLLKDGDAFPIEVRVLAVGHRGAIDRMMGGPNKEWIENVDTSAKNNHCFDDSYIKKMQDKGYAIKSYIADSAVTSLKDGIAELKSSGATHVLFGTSHIARANIPMNVSEGKNFSIFLEELLKRTTNEEQAHYGRFDGLQVGENEALPEGCFQSHEMGFADYVRMAGTVASVAVGVIGAKTGNVDMANMASNANTALDRGGVSADGTKASVIRPALARYVGWQIYGFVDMAAFVAQPGKATYTGVAFPISEVEAELSRYMDIPHQTKIKNY